LRYRDRAKFLRDSSTPDINSKYTSANDTLLLTSSRQWRRATFHLPALRLGHGQNGGADFRLQGRYAFRSITLTRRRPEGYDPQQPIDPDALRSLAVERPPGMELTFGNDASPTDAAIFKALSVTSVESYVDWAGVEPEPGKWDWSKWDQQVATLQKARLKWVPFLIAGPAYATPLWFQQGPDAHVYRCLEHGLDSKVQSLFNPRLRPQIERFLQAFADRYRDTGVIESVLLGVTGIYGESIYPAGPEGGWTAQLTSPYHNHHGWWAGDVLAAASFRDALRGQYNSITTLNKAWGTTHGDFAKVAPFLPDQAPNDRARADFVEWYQQAMTDWSVFWVNTTRKVFPNTPIYLCTGGDGNPYLADFTAQTAAITRAGAGVRITNEGSDYAQNFSITREVATATRHYGTFCGFEPASAVDAGGVIARIYNATASGARQLHDYTPNTLGQGAQALQNFRSHAAFLVPRRPRLEAAQYLARETWALDPHAIGRTYALSRVLRDVANVDFVTRRSVIDGHLRQYRVLVLMESAVLEPKAAEAIEAWVRDGGTLIAATQPGETLGGRLYDQAAWRERLLSAVASSGELGRMALAGDAPAHWLLHVGSEADQPWLDGDWHGREQGYEWRDVPGARMRWSGGRSEVLLPIQPGVDHTLRLELSVPSFALGQSGVSVRIGQRPLGVIRRAGKQVCEFPLPAALVGHESVARLEFSAEAWNPSERTPGSQDGRQLGFSLHQVELIRHGAEDAPASAAALRFVLDKPRLAAQTRTVGKGRTIFLPALAGNSQLLAVVFASALLSPVDGQVDERFATETDTGVWWFDSKSPRIWQTAR
jgi:Glycosyl hydrolase family 14